MKLIGILIYITLISGCTTGSLTKSELTEMTHNIASEEICKNTNYRYCTSTATYSNCLHELSVYKTVCSRNSFLESTGSLISEQERILAAKESVVYSKCIVNMHFTDRHQEVSKDSRCKDLKMLTSQ